MWTRSVISSPGSRTTVSASGVGGGGEGGRGGMSSTGTRRSGLRSDNGWAVETTSHTESRDLERCIALEAVSQRDLEEKEKGMGTDERVESKRIITTTTEVPRNEQDNAGPSERGGDMASRSP